MDSGYYAAMTGLVARTQALDTAAANLANAQTPGYRAEREFFRSALLGPDAADSQLGETVNNYGLLGGDRLSMAQGALEPTGNPLDLAIEGQGFFMVQTPNGPRYTRDGSFHRAQNGQLGHAGRRAGAFRGGPADSDSARRGHGRRRRGGFGGRRRRRAGGRLCVSRRDRAHAGGREPLCSAEGSQGQPLRRTHRSTRAPSRPPIRM